MTGPSDNVDVFMKAIEHAKGYVERQLGPKLQAAVQAQIERHTKDVWVCMEALQGELAEVQAEAKALRHELAEVRSELETSRAKHDRHARELLGGAPLMRWRGRYRDGLAYGRGDLVQHRGAAWVCICGTREAPSCGQSWVRLTRPPRNRSARRADERASAPQEAPQATGPILTVVAGGAARAGGRAAG